MRAVVTTTQGAPVAPNVEYRTDWPDLKEPSPGYVNIKTIATALNHMDLWVGMGIPGVDLAYPRISGCDACGTVVALGQGVDPCMLVKANTYAHTSIIESALPCSGRHAASLGSPGRPS